MTINFWPNLIDGLPRCRLVLFSFFLYFLFFENNELTLIFQQQKEQLPMKLNTQFFKQLPICNHVKLSTTYKQFEIRKQKQRKKTRKKINI